MKKHKKSIIVIALGCALGITSCEKILDVKQVSEITTSSMWESEGDFQSAVNGMYVYFREAFSTDLLLWGDLRSGLYSGGKIVEVGHSNIMNNTIYRDNSGTDWTRLYTTINSANLIIKYADQNLTEGAVRNQVLADAHFIRAFCYFWIARIWGDAPILTQGFESDKQDDLLPSRAPVAEVFAQVEKDLSRAEALLPASVNNKTRISPGGLNMLKAEYFLWKAKQQDGGQTALTAADEALNAVISDGYSLLPEFSRVFDVSSEKNDEIIFTINVQREEFLGGYPIWFLIPNQYLVDKSLIENPVKIGSHQQYISLTDAYNDMIVSQADDTRKNVSVMNVTENGVHHRWINKLAGEWTNDTRFFSSNIPIYRLAEAYLMKAEVQNALGNPVEAVRLLNIVAERAYGTANYYPSALGQEEVKDRIIEAYLKEFVAEGKSWFVFVRNDVAFTRVPGLEGKEGVKNILLWPITSASINNNPNIEQTEGFN